MAIKGLSIPVFGKYNYDSAKGTVTYTDGMINPHAIEYTFTPEAADGTPLYGDNRIIENDRQTFSTGTLSLGVDDLVQEVSKYLLGVKTVEQEYGDGKTAVVTVYDDDQNAPTLGVGIIELHQNDDVDHYRAVILKKAIFNLPEDTATTRGESVKWQTKTIEGTVSRSDENTAEQKHPWIMTHGSTARPMRWSGLSGAWALERLERLLYRVPPEPQPEPRRSPLLPQRPERMCTTISSAKIWSFPDTMRIAPA